MTRSTLRAKLVLLLALAMPLVVSIDADTASATFPGRDGMVVFASDRAPNFGRPQIYQVRTDGSTRKRRLSTSTEPESAPARAPNGRWIAFVRSHDLYVMRTDGSDARRLAGGARSGTVPEGEGGDGPVWSRDGKRIAFPLTAGGIAVVDSDGTSLGQITGDGRAPSWSPDGKSLAFQRYIPLSRGARGEIHVVRSDGTDDVKIADGIGPPVWSPRGPLIAFVNDDFRLIVAKSDGTEFRDFGPSSSTAAWSPKGTQIAFSSPTGQGAAIVAVGLAGESRRKLTSGAAFDSAPRWSPSGRRIAFVRDRYQLEPHVAQLYAVDARGSREQRLTSQPPGSVFDGFFWTNDEKRIVFSTQQDQSDTDIYAISPESGRLTALTTNSLWDAAPRWSPGGTRIAFTRGNGVSCCVPSFATGIYTMRADGSGVRNITAGSSGLHVYPSWSPDGKRVAFVRIRTGWTDADVFVVDTDGSRPRRISRESGEYTGLTWSPDGTSFAFLRGGRVFTLSADGSETTQLTTSGPYAIGVAWAPDGRQIAFSRSYDFGIGVVNADGSEEKTLVPELKAADIAWSPDGRRLVFADFGAVGGQRLSVVNIADGVTSRLEEVSLDLGRDYTPDWQALR